MSAIAIIPARGGSQRIPGKNHKLFKGIPIISYSIAKAAKSELFEYTVVSTDSHEIARIANAMDCVVHWRPEIMCQDDVGTLEVTQDAARWFTADLYCCIYPTAPLMQTHDLDRGNRAMIDGDNLHAFSVGGDPLRDAGQFYWSTARALTDRRRLIAPHSAMILIEERHVCDINTPEDWARAETMYDQLDASEQ